MAAADDMSIEKLKKDMDDSIWNNPKIFSTEKPWYYYVHAFTVDEDATILVGKGEVKQIRLICESMDGRIAVSDCETGLGKLEGVSTSDIETIAERLQIRLPAPEVVSPEQMKIVWDAMVKRLVRNAVMEQYVANPSWWNP